MLPPPIVIPTTMNNSNYNPALDTLQQSAFFYSNTTRTENSAHAGTRFKNFFHKTLANVTKANFDAISSLNRNSTSLSVKEVLATEVYDGLITEAIAGGSGNGYTTAANMAVTSLANTTQHLEITPTFPIAQTMATFIETGNKNRGTTIIVYPTVTPESIVIPIVSCIFGFPILAFIVICCLRHRAKLARERDRRRNYDMQDHAVSLVRFSPIHRLNYRSSRAISLRPERSLSQGFTSLELDTVIEERCSDIEQTQTEILQPESPMESSTTTVTYKLSFSRS